jgi:hypothetical protein
MTAVAFKINPQLTMKAGAADDMVQATHVNRVHASHYPGGFYPVDFRLPMPVEASMAPDMRLLFGS